MTTTERLADHVRRTVDGPMWHGPALNELLRDVSHEDAARHPVPGAHSIWELVLHITAWCSIVRLRIAGDAVAQVTDDMDWPPVASPSADRSPC